MKRTKLELRVAHYRFLRIACPVASAMIAYLYCVTTPQVACSAGIDVALITNGVATQDENDIRAYLNADSRLSSTTLFQADLVVPSLAQLVPYEAVLYTSDSFFHTRANDMPIGNLLANYVDAGGGAVLATFAFGSGGNDLGLLGRITTTGYSPFLVPPNQGQSNGGTLNIATANLAHPTMTGVNVFTSIFSNGNMSLDVGASVIAHYTNGDELIAENASRKIVDINAFPSPGASRGQAFLTGNYAQLVTNSLVYVARVPEPSTAALTTLVGAAVAICARRRR
jgi:hypothetical protein